MSLDLVFDLLLSLGFCENTASLYSCLLEHGPLTLSDLTSKTTIEEKRVVPLLGMLIANTLVFEDSGKYWVLNPRRSFKAYADNVLWSVTSTISDGLDDVPEGKIEFVGAVRDTCQQLQKAASELYTHQSPIAVGRIKIATDPDQLAALLAEAIDKAEDTILGVSTAPQMPQLSVIWGTLVSRIRSGVRYIRVVDIEEIIQNGYIISRRDVEDVGVELYIASKEWIDSKYYVVDDKFVIIFMPDKYSARDFTLTGQVISNKLIVGKYRSAFQLLLEKSIPASSALELMAVKRESLLAYAKHTLDELEMRWLECLTDFGVFCKFSELDATRLTVAQDRATQAQLVEVRETKLGTIAPLPNYSWSFADVQQYWAAKNRQE